MRVALVGTGPWARIAHGPGLAAADGVELAGVWGRSPERAATIATELGVPAYDDYAALLADVEAVAFAVPPHVQGALALEAALAGKHLLLDKPVAADLASALVLQEAVTTAGVSSVIFFTDRFASATRDWLEEVRRVGGWRGGWTRWLTTLDAPGNPFGSSPWRHERGALWDLGPHVLSTLGAALGPVLSVHAVGGPRDLVTLVLQHEGGATSTATLTAFAPPAAACCETVLWGEAGLSPLPPREERSDAALLAVAARELAAAAASGEQHPMDVSVGVRVVELLEEAQHQLAAP